MTVEQITRDHQWIQYSTFYNAYPIHNELHPTMREADFSAKGDGGYFIDTYYGRIFDAKYDSAGALYGQTERMTHYVNVRGLEIVDEFRVPYRRIPIFGVDDGDVIAKLVGDLKKRNPTHKVLLRGQTRTYFLGRSEDECGRFYGAKSVREPSFLPSHLRNNFDELFLQSMWQNQAAILLNDLGYDYSAHLGREEMQEYLDSAERIKNSFLMTPFALGIAQHYGLPSVGLDLTDDLDVAGWFASNEMSIRDSGFTTTEPVTRSEDIDPVIFVFRCPEDAVFDYKVVRPKIFPVSRPDQQSAWFGHVGWGVASNQLGSYLMCGFKLTDEYLADLDGDLTEKLFPKISEDPLLEYFVKMRGLDKYEGEAKRALKKIYYLG